MARRKDPSVPTTVWIEHGNGDHFVLTAKMTGKDAARLSRILERRAENQDIADFGLALATHPLSFKKALLSIERALGLPESVLLEEQE